MRSVAFAVLCTIVAVSIPFFTYAQTPDTSIALQLDPAFPQPGESYTATLVGNNRAGSIRWFENGSEIAAGQNQNSIRLVAPSSGTTQTLTTRVTYPDGTTAQAYQTVVPYRIDLLVEPNTETPPFYQGRPLPTSGSTVTVTALVFKGQTSLSNLSYLWKINGKTQNGGAVYGENNTSFVPSFESQTVVEVQVQNSGGKTIAARSMAIPISKPEIHFYEVDPLQGMSSIALQDPYPFIGDEVTLHAESFFMSKYLSPDAVSQEWEINGNTVAGNEDDSQEITLVKKQESGSADLSYSIRYLEQLLQSAQAHITVQF